MLLLKFSCSPFFQRKIKALTQSLQLRGKLILLKYCIFFKDRLAPGFWPKRNYKFLFHFSFVIIDFINSVKSEKTKRDRN